MQQRHWNLAASVVRPFLAGVVLAHRRDFDSVSQRGAAQCVLFKKDPAYLRGSFFGFPAKIVL